jgi:hypothetical protein
MGAYREGDFTYSEENFNFSNNTNVSSTDSRILDGPKMGSREVYS